MFDTMGSVLIIDDESVITDLLKEILEEDYSVESTTSSVDGLARVRAKLPDVILLDINMPEINGYELCRLLKSDSETRNIPIIFITALSTPENETLGLETGAADYIVKPINPSIVMARVKNQMEVKKQRDYLEQLSSIDSMTGVYNRRYFDECLDREWRRCQRSQSALSLVLMDIDYFKAYNDRYGHVAGDDCLKVVAGKLQQVPQRGGDVLARFGGEEFVAVLPDTPYEFVQFMAEKFRRAVAEAAITHVSSKVSDVVTVCVGGATVKPDNTFSPLELLQLADQMLYKAKSEGRNRSYTTCLDTSPGEATAEKAARKSRC